MTLKVIFWPTHTKYKSQKRHLDKIKILYKYIKIAVVAIKIAIFMHLYR